MTPDYQQNILSTVELRHAEDHYSAVVSNEAIAANRYNLAVTSYVEAEDTREVVDIEALNADIAGLSPVRPNSGHRSNQIVADLEAGGHALV